MKHFLPLLSRRFRRLNLALWIVLTPAFGIADATAETGQNLEKTAQLCTQQTARLERTEKIPAHMLTAISLTETGRWQKGKREILAWPWTVTAHGRGQHFDSKAEALMEVEILMTQGVRNIDVGCMQVNLKYHEQAFASLSDALDPKTNTTYAAQFLKKLYDQKGDWMDAVGAYHSATPDKNLKYRQRMVRLWNKTRGERFAPETEQEPETGVLTATATATSKAPTTSHAARDIDHARIRALNESFRARRNADPIASAEQDRFLKQAMQRHEELNAWREAQVQGIDSRHWATMRRAERALREQKELEARDKPSFDERRKQQLGAWRESALWIPTH